MSVSALRDALPADSVIAPDEWGGGAGLRGTPEAVLAPRDVEGVVEGLRWAERAGVGVVPAGSGDRLPPVDVRAPFVVMTSRELAGIDIYEPADLTFTAGAGTRRSDLAAALAPNRQWLPFDPTDVGARSLGGLVASAASGPLATGYGSLRNHVLGATVVTGDGRVLRLGGRVVKNVAGFDLLKPTVGGEGRLGFLVSICMRTFPVPDVDRVLVARASKASELAALAVRISTAPVLPVSCTITDDGEGARLVVRLHGALATVDVDQGVIERHTGGDFESMSHDDASVAIGADTPIVEGVRVVISARPSRLPNVLAAIEAAGSTFVRADCYAASVEATFSSPSSSTRSETDDAPAGDRLELSERLATLRREVESVGGAVSIGSAPRDIDPIGLETRPRPAEAALAEKVRAVFDPKGVLWPSRA